MSKAERFVIKGKAHWAHVYKVNQLSNKYQVDLSIDEETATTLEKQGIKIQHKDDARGTYITLKSSYPPDVIDSKKKKTEVQIGNGSSVTVATHIYDWKFGAKKGKSLGLDAVQVTELVSYEKGEKNQGSVYGSLFNEEDGYESNGNSPQVSNDNPF